MKTHLDEIEKVKTTYQLITFQTTTLRLRSSINRSHWRRGCLLIPLVLVCFGLSPAARAADGDLGNANTAEGVDALFSLTSGIGNTGLGFEALFSNTSGDDNTANGEAALRFNKTGYNNSATGAFALYNTTGYENTGLGFEALNSNTTGVNNIAVGQRAGEISPRAITISISATLALRPSPTPSASARRRKGASLAAERAPLLSASVGQLLAVAWRFALTQTANWAASPPRRVSSEISSRWTRPAKRFTR